MKQDCTSNGHPNLFDPLMVGDVVYRNRVLLAPLSGITDVPFRRLAWEGGAGMVVSEMVASEAFVTGQDEMRVKSEGAGLPVHVVQLAGREPRWMAEAARMATGAGADVIDINMGCPARKVVTGLSGSALMRDLDLAVELIGATIAAVEVPVTVKMRLGWDEGSINAPELAARATDAGVAAVTVHARTRNQFYKGNADWTKVAAVRARCPVPLIVNGDIADIDDANLALRRSGADAIMVGRAACGRPWLIGELAGRGGPPADLAAYVGTHMREIREHHGTKLGIRMGRKHLQWYAESAGLDGTPTLATLLRETSPDAVDELVQLVFGEARTLRQAA